MNNRNYSVQTQIARPIEQVFQAVVEENQLAKYFVGTATGPLREGRHVVWYWEEWGHYPVTVKRVIPNQRIELEIDTVAWKKYTSQGYPVLITMEFERLSENSTMITISESGWRSDEPGYKASHENCSGWTHMSLCLKAYLEYGIDLRGLSPIPPS